MNRIGVTGLHVGGVQVPRFEIQSASGLICTSVAPSKRVVSQSDTRSRLVLATRTACLTAVGSSGRPATAAASRVRGMANKNPNSAPAAAAAQAVSPYNPIFFRKIGQREPAAALASPKLHRDKPTIPTTAKAMMARAIHRVASNIF